jgi:hypothetical protein
MGTYELLVIRKEDASGSLLVITVITRIEDFNSRFLAWVRDLGCDSISEERSAQEKGKEKKVTH